LLYKYYVKPIWHYFFFSLLFSPLMSLPCEHSFHQEEVVGLTLPPPGGDFSLRRSAFFRQCTVATCSTTLNLSLGGSCDDTCPTRAAVRRLWPPSPLPAACFCVCVIIFFFSGHSLLVYLYQILWKYLLVNCKISPISLESERYCKRGSSVILVKFEFLLR